MKKFAIILGVMFMVFCGKAQSTEITVSGAVSLEDAFLEMKSLYEKDSDMAHFNFAASNPLLRQIVGGAPVDVFASADQETMDKAEKAGVIDPQTRKDFAGNTLVVIVPKGAPKPATLEDLLKSSRIAIGDPQSVPAGRYACQVLNKAGLWEKFDDKLIASTSVRQALDYVARGEVDAGFVYGTDAAKMSPKVDVAFVAEGHDPVIYPIAVATTGNNPKGGQKFIEFVLSPEGQAILGKYGFVSVNGKGQ